MILETKSTTIAYRCPHCGSSIISEVRQYTLSNDMLKLKCDCGESELILTRTHDGKIRFSIPCIICPQNHNYTLSASLFFAKDIFTLSCTYTGIDICFIGEKDRVFKRLEESEGEILELLGDSTLAALPRNSNNDDSFFEAQVSDVISYMLAELKEEAKLHCKCENDDGIYKFEYTPEGINIFCERCEAKKVIEVNNVVSANDFLQSDELHLL